MQSRLHSYAAHSRQARDARLGGGSCDARLDPHQAAPELVRVAARVELRRLAREIARRGERGCVRRRDSRPVT